jgi:hypothetical protein
MSSSSPARPAAPQAGRKARRALILVLTRTAVAVSSAAVLAAAPTLSASAASTRPASAAAAASSAVQAAPDGSTWVLVYGWYPTQSACREVGINDYMVPNGIAFKCVEINRGDYFTWALYILGHY